MNYGFFEFEYMLINMMAECSGGARHQFFLFLFVCLFFLGGGAIELRGKPIFGGTIRRQTNFLWGGGGN